MVVFCWDFIYRQLEANESVHTRPPIEKNRISWSPTALLIKVHEEQKLFNRKKAEVYITSIKNKAWVTLNHHHILSGTVAIRINYTFRC